MRLTRVVSKKTGRVGYRGRYVDPVTKRRCKHTEWFADKPKAEAAWKLFLDNLNARKLGLPDNSGWQSSYKEIVKRFLAEAPISTDDRREMLRHYLELNPLHMNAGSDFTAKGRLTAAAMKIAQQRGGAFVRRYVQAPLKQVSAWAASIGIFPYDPLHSWKQLPLTKAPRRTESFSPDEIRAILLAADDMDALCNRAFPVSLIFKTALITGNRPGALFAAQAKDLRSDRIQLSPGCGKKRNGRCMIPPLFAAELARYIAARNALPTDPLLVSPEGRPVDRWRIRDMFRRAAILAYVRMAWPQADPDAGRASPMDVALAIYAGRVSGFDGAPPKDTEKLAARDAKRKSIEALVERLKPRVDAALENRPMYALRHTHITWARAAGVNTDSIKSQVGHSGGGIEEIHYLDARIVDAGASSLAVWNILTGAKELARGKALQVLPLAAGAEQMAPVVAPDDEKAPSGAKSGIAQVVGAKENGRYWTRTSDPQLVELVL